MVGLVATLWRARLLAPLRPDKYVRMAAAMAREGASVTVGFAAAAQRCPDRAGLVDELGTLTWRQLDARADSFAAALQALPGGPPTQLGIMCRNHRGFIAALVAATRIGADVLLLNTSFAGPALATVLGREGIDAIVFDDEFAGIVETALADRPEATRIIAWTDHPGGGARTVESLIDAHAGNRPRRTARKSRMIC